MGWDHSENRGAVRPVGMKSAIELTDDTSKHCSLLRSRANVCGLQIVKDELAIRLAVKLAASYDSHDAPITALDGVLRYVT
jgi:hypothetical protein